MALVPLFIHPAAVLLCHCRGEALLQISLLHCSVSAFIARTINAAGSYHQMLLLHVSCSPSVVAVTATDGARGAPFSNYIAAESISLLASTLAAPGTAIFSTMSFDRDPSGYKASRL
jgi:hypothetical protein